MITLEMMPPLMFGGLVLAMLIGFPVAFTLAAVGLSFGFLVHLSRILRPQLPPGDPRPRVRQRAFQRAAARDPVLHLHGRHIREMWTRRGHAGFDGPAVRPGPRRPRLFRHHRRLHPRRHHRHGGGAGHRHGADLDAGDDPLRLQHALHHRRARGLRHDHAAGAALAGADRARRPARQVGRRHVSRRLGPLGVPDHAVRRLHLHPRPDQAGATCRRCRRKRAR